MKHQEHHLIRKQLNHPKYSAFAQKTSTNADTSSKGSNGLSKSDIIAIVACVLGVPGAIAAVITLAQCGN